MNHVVNHILEFWLSAQTDLIEFVESNPISMKYRIWNILILQQDNYDLKFALEGDSVKLNPQ